MPNSDRRRLLSERRGYICRWLVNHGFVHSHSYVSHAEYGDGLFSYCVRYEIDDDLDGYAQHLDRLEACLCKHHDTYVRYGDVVSSIDDRVALLEARVGKLEARL